MQKGTPLDRTIDFLTGGKGMSLAKYTKNRAETEKIFPYVRNARKEGSGKVRKQVGENVKRGSEEPRDRWFDAEMAVLKA